MTIHEMADALRPFLRYSRAVNLLGRLPFESDRTSANFIEKFGDELEAMLGRRPVVERSEYSPSGRGAFGRLGGSDRRGVYRPLAVRWSNE